MIEEIYSLFRQHPHISTDSRAITAGSIFFALRGESFDGNKYALSALEKGAIACVIDDPALFGKDERLILVDDTLLALQQLANRHRRELAIEILAITGSNGKTTTKELLAGVLSQKYKLFATRGNLNNHIGVPLTLLSMGQDIEFGIVEMGASHCGEIALLCDIAEPNYGIITNIGRAHLEGFGGVEGVKSGKGELIDYLARSGGELFVAQPNETIMQMAHKHEGLKRNEYRYEIGDNVQHNLEGDYNRYNVAAAVAIGEHFGVCEKGIRNAIASYTPSNNRSQRSVTQHNTLIIDCYNANPSSMEVALTNFIGDHDLTHSAKAVVLGDMRELGEWSLEEHKKVISQALNSQVERIILVGSEFSQAAKLCDTTDSRIELFSDCGKLQEHLQTVPLSGYSILIKGSRGIRLEQIVTLL